MVRGFGLEREEADAVQPNTLNVVFFFQSSLERRLVGVQARGVLVQGLAWGRDLLVGLEGRGWTKLGPSPGQPGHTDGHLLGVWLQQSVWPRGLKAN